MGLAIVRYGAALLLLLYGFAKINGSQFTILDSELDKPMGQVSGFWLTWYYFGFSKLYGTFLALAQMLGAMLLTFRRTTLLGASLLLPILGNIVLIDLCYGVDVGATFVAVLLLCVVLGLLAGHARDLVDLFWTRQQVQRGMSFRGASATRWALRAALVIAAFGFTYWVANHNNRYPTPIDGAWEVVRVEPSDGAEKIPQRIYFEYNRAFLCVFRFRDGSSASHHFEANPSGSTLGIWKQWLRKGAAIFEGSYTLEGARLSLSGEMASVGKVVLVLERRGVR